MTLNTDGTLRVKANSLKFPQGHYIYKLDSLGCTLKLNLKQKPFSYTYTRITTSFGEAIGRFSRVDSDVYLCGDFDVF